MNKLPYSVGDDVQVKYPTQDGYIWLDAVVTARDRISALVRFPDGKAQAVPYDRLQAAPNKERA